MFLKFALAAVLLVFSSHAAAVSCEVAATDVDFGPYDYWANSTAQGSFVVTCRSDLIDLGGLVTYELSLTTGQSNTYVNRELSFGGSVLNYNLYTDLTYATVWGDGSESSETVMDSVVVGACVLILGCVPVSDLPITVYGRIPSGQNVPAGGPYTDTGGITVTVTF